MSSVMNTEFTVECFVHRILTHWFHHKRNVCNYVHSLHTTSLNNINSINHPIHAKRCTIYTMVHSILFCTTLRTWRDAENALVLCHFVLLLNWHLQHCALPLLSVVLVWIEACTVMSVVFLHCSHLSLIYWGLCLLMKSLKSLVI
jgi:hypothetical protein